jgi:hypothetical protein
VASGDASTRALNDHHTPACRSHTRHVNRADLMGSAGLVYRAGFVLVAAGGSALSGSDPGRGLAADRAPAGREEA